jgi:hypothetical protein
MNLGIAENPVAAADEVGRLPGYGRLAGCRKTARTGGQVATRPAETISQALSAAMRITTGSSTWGKDDPRPRPRRPRRLRRRHLRRLRRRHLRRPWRGQPRGLSRSRNGSAVAVPTGRPGAAVGLRRLARKNSTPDTARVNLARARPGPDRGRSPVAPSRCGRAARPTCCSIRRLRTTHSRSTRPRTTVSGEPSHRSKIGSGIGSLGTGRRHGGGSGSRAGGWTPPSTPGRYTLVSAPPRLPAPGPRDPGPTTIRSRTLAPAGHAPGPTTIRSRTPMRDASRFVAGAGRPSQAVHGLRPAMSQRPRSCRRSSRRVGAGQPASRGRAAGRSPARAGQGRARVGQRSARHDPGPAVGCGSRLWSCLDRRLS